MVVYITNDVKKSLNDYKRALRHYPISRQRAHEKYNHMVVENRTNKKPPVNKVYIINEWWKPDGDEIKRRLRNSVPDVIPEVMEYYCETKALYGARRLKHLGDLG